MKLSQGEILRRYAELVVECGWGGKKGIKGRPVHIYHSVPAYPVLCAIAEEAYRKGACRVDYTTWSPRLEALHVNHADSKNLGKIPKTWADRWNDLVPSRGATLRIEGCDEPLALAACDPKRVSIFEGAKMASRKLFYDEGLHGGKTPWCIIPFATEDWAHQLFPRMSPSAARKRLEAALIKVLDLDKDDFIARWKSRGERINRRAILLDQHKFDHLLFTGRGTKLTVGISEKARFGGGQHDQGPKGVKFFANLPTFENFTTPDFRRTDGVVNVTRPVMINGQTVEGLKVWFKNGIAVKFTARHGGKAFQAMLDADPGAKRLGEVALVGIDDSPIFQTGITFQSILLDENAACHIAFGRAYVDRLKGGVKMSSAEKAAVGCNESKVHVDCMISDEHTAVHGISRSGAKTQIIEDGEWTGVFRCP